MDPNCKQCQEIVAFEKQLDARAVSRDEKVLAMCSPVIERNNARWRTFAWWCQLPFIGKMIFRHFTVPFMLEKLPKWYESAEYKKDTTEINKDAWTLENLKKADLEHWGDEVVVVMDSSDPAGYYTPIRAPRRECYAHGVSAFSDKYDSVNKKLEAKEIVLCWVTRQLVARSDCSARFDQSGVKYWLERLMPADPQFPGFNEWRDDSHPALKNLNALDRKRDHAIDTLLRS